MSLPTNSDLRELIAKEEARAAATVRRLRIVTFILTHRALIAGAVSFIVGVVLGHKL